MAKAIEEMIAETFGALLILKSDSGIWVAVDNRNRLIVSKDKETWEELKLDEGQQKTIAQADFKIG